VALFDFFFVPPHFSFNVSDAQYLITFMVMLVTALITSELTTNLRTQASIAQEKEQRAQALYEMAQALTGALTIEQVSQTVETFLQKSINSQSFILLPNKEETLFLPSASMLPSHIEQRWAQVTFTSGKSIVIADPPDDSIFYLPLRAPMRMRGVLVIVSKEHHISNEHKQLCEAVASLTAIVLERLHYVDVAQEHQLDITAERLRSSILSAISHDLRTPLTVLIGLADSLLLTQPPLSPTAQEITHALRTQSARLHSLVINLLDMARLQVGKAPLRKEWHLLQEVVGSSLHLLGNTLDHHELKISLPDNLPLIEFDALLIERVLCNLIENAVKYSPAHSIITISATLQANEIAVSVSDNGPGFSFSKNDFFDLFTRGQHESATSGVGLGLAICRSIIEAHGGHITATNNEDGGACVTFTLALGTPPSITQESEVHE
jgi:two-component system sensor histidine kinase KdpD